MKIPFDIKYRPQIESGEYKVVTGDNRPVRIISWDKRVVGGRIEIVCLVPASQGDTETVQLYYPDGTLISGWSEKFKLFIITPEPELTESEDERVRKELIEAIEVARVFDIDKEVADRWIAYLEKQKEYVSDNFDDVWTTEDCAEIIEAGEKLSPRFKELFKEVCHAWYDKGIELEKQKEPNYTKRNELFDKYVENCDPEIMKEVSDVIDKELQKEQKPAEWSDADEGMINCIIATLCEESHGGREKNDLMVSWLDKLRKSLRPQLHWKPSKEQMKNLKGAYMCDLSAGLHTRAGILLTLYNDLKKLM